MILKFIIVIIATNISAFSLGYTVSAMERKPRRNKNKQKNDACSKCGGKDIHEINHNYQCLDCGHTWY